MDNCGSFDKLIPLLPKEYGYLTFDLPGHGLSYRYEPGQIYSYYDTIVLMERIRKEYNWDKLSLIGHSLGGLCGFQYAALFPDKIDLFVALDTLVPYITEPVPLMKVNIEALLSVDDNEKSGNFDNEPPSYDYEELLDRIVKGSSSSVTRENAKYLLTRSVKNSRKPGKYYFNYDRRLKGFDRPSRGNEDLLKFAKNVCCPLLYCYAEESYMRPLSFAKVAPIQDYLVANHPNFHVLKGPGTHHFHLTHPEAYSSEISKFIRKCRPALKAKL